MGDIGTRIQRYRLSRYAPPGSREHRRLRWLWLGCALWLVWVSFLSEHSFFRLWQLHREDQANRERLKTVNAEVERLSRNAGDPATRKQAVERELRERVQMARPGEIIYRYDGDEVKPADPK